MKNMNHKSIWSKLLSRTASTNSDPAQQPRSKRQGMLRRLTSLTLSAVLFGTVSAGTFYGVNQLLPQQDQGTSVAESSGAVLTSLASTTYSGVRYGMDVSDIAAAALPSVVAITNISVQEVTNFFHRFGPNGSGQTELQETTSCGSALSSPMTALICIS